MKWLLLLCITTISVFAQPSQDDLNIEISRRISVDLLGPNADPFMQPLTQTLNATANSRFFRTAEIPDTGFYFRVSVGSMLGFVRNDQKTYTPVAPTISQDMFLKRVFTDKDLIDVNILNPSMSTIKDTTGLVVVIMKYLFEKGLTDPNSGFYFPDSAATVYGDRDERFVIGKQYLADQITGGDPLLGTVYNALTPELKQSIMNTITGLPNYLTLARGANVNTVVAGVPQIEIGSFLGTEIMLRYIPPIKYDTVVGKFSFWGIGIKHSINQYWEKAPFNLAAQFVYQGSSIENSVGATNSQLSANTTIMGVNVQASKEWEGFNFYTGFAYETISINTDFTFYLPKELQRQLGLLPLDSDNPRPPMYPGDQRPQYTNALFKDNAVKFTMGISKTFGSLGICLDYNISKFNIVTLGVDVGF
jgi:hypothetical protein